VDSVFLGFNDASLGDQILTFWPLNIMTLCCLRMSGSDYPVTQRHIPEEWSGQLQCCQNPKTHTSGKEIRQAGLKHVAFVK